jgi:hypothetical protein
MIGTNDEALFERTFSALTGHAPLSWQRRLFLEHFLRGDIPAALDIPTGLGKTSVIAIWLAARALAGEDAHKALPRRLVYVVDRRAVVDQATAEAERLRRALEGEAEHFDALDASARAQARQTTAELKKRLGFDAHGAPLPAIRVHEFRSQDNKHLHFELLAEKDPDEQLAKAALALATKDGKFSRVVVFCDRRDRNDGSDGPSARGVKEQIEKLARPDKKAARRSATLSRLRELGFMGAKKPLLKPAFLVATSAGEVGIDVDSDHMACDLVPWERMIQRLGRVNRRGNGYATISVFTGEPKPTKRQQNALDKRGRGEELQDKERKAVEEFEEKQKKWRSWKQPFDHLPPNHFGIDVSLGALLKLADSARSDARLRSLMSAAMTLAVC